MVTIYAGPFEIHNGRVYRIADRDREPVWEVGDSDENLKVVLEECISYGKAERSKEIGKLLGVSK